MYIPGWNNTDVKSRVIRFTLYLIILWVTFGTTLKKTIIVKYTLHGQNDSRIWTLTFICMELFFRKHFITLRWWRWFLVCMYLCIICMMYPCTFIRFSVPNFHFGFVSGVTSHGLSCEICKFKAHKKCASKALTNCKWTTLASMGKDIIEEPDGVRRNYFL